MRQQDEFEKFIRHQEFGKIIDLAGRLKNHRSRLVSFASPENNANDASSLLRTPRSRSSRIKDSQSESNELAQRDYSNTIGNRGQFLGQRPSSRRGGSRQSYHSPQSIENTADLIRSALVRSPVDDLDSKSARAPSATIERGEYPITDSLIDETIQSLAEELRYCLDLKKELNKTAANSRIISPPNNEDKTSPFNPRFAKWQTDILQEWMIAHREHPFPTKKDAEPLAIATGLSQNQVMLWLNNARRRHMNMVLDRQRKPRDFLDYLFLATDRERQIMKEHSNKTLSLQNDRVTIPDALLLASMPLENSVTSSQAVTPLNSNPTRKRSTKKPRQQGSTTQPPRYTYPRPPPTQSSSGPMPSKSSSKLMPSPSHHNAISYAVNSNIDERPYSMTRPKNADQVFRRGKTFHNIAGPTRIHNAHTNAASRPNDIDLPELPPPNFNSSVLHRGISDCEHETKHRTSEQKLIQMYTPNGVIETPEGSLDGSFDAGSIDDNLFERFYVPPLTHKDDWIEPDDANNSCSEDEQRMSHRDDVFDVNEALGGPYDDYERDYLNGLL